MSAYYNEFDAKTAAWLRELIRRGLIADGIVDDRSITEVTPDDLRGFTQSHFFAGIGGWSAALRLAGWSDARPVWTGSPPCQPFSAAGQQEGAADERNLWPMYFRLIAQCRPATLFGEQVGAAIGFGWLDAVFTDLEGEGYACAATVLPACGVGAPHIRQRLWIVADSNGGRQFGGGKNSGRDDGYTRNSERQKGIMADAQLPRRWTCAVDGNDDHAEAPGRDQSASSTRECGATGIMADASGAIITANETTRRSSQQFRGSCDAGQWSDLEWLPCADGKARPTKPGLFPLADGVPGRVGLLRGAGNAIVPQVAAEVIGAYMDITA